MSCMGPLRDLIYIVSVVYVGFLNVTNDTCGTFDSRMWISRIVVRLFSSVFVSSGPSQPSQNGGQAGHPPLRPWSLAGSTLPFRSPPRYIFFGDPPRASEGAQLQSMIKYSQITKGFWGFTFNAVFSIKSLNASGKGSFSINPIAVFSWNLRTTIPNMCPVLRDKTA